MCRKAGQHPFKTASEGQAREGLLFVNKKKQKSVRNLLPLARVCGGTRGEGNLSYTRGPSGSRCGATAMKRLGAIGVPIFSAIAWASTARSAPLRRVASRRWSVQFSTVQTSTQPSAWAMSS